MEPKRFSPQPQAPQAETKKSPPRAAVDAAAAGAESPLSTLFYSPSHGPKGKEQDLYALLSSKGQNGSAQAGMTGNGKSEWTPAKTHTSYTKDNKYPHGTVDTSCFGSSVHYGGRDYFYGSSTPKQAAEADDKKFDKKDPSADSHGDWWQGSFYY